VADFDVRERLVDAAYVTVGLSLLGFQRAQVRRHRWSRQVSSVARTVNETVGPVRTDLDHQLDQLEERLPGQARTAVRSLRAVAQLSEQLLRQVPGVPTAQGATPGNGAPGNGGAGNGGAGNGGAGNREAGARP